ncbi:phage holin family protein [Planctomonas deserti]|uniref:phage holin family protein n=1 Tax=Planctomonas deserti TaxID=2144185 RepID=UPI000D3B10D5|nr:phage holin family protein [Planctomonas deserti]
MATTSIPFNPKTRQSLIALVRDLPSLLVRLAKAELQQFMIGLKAKLLQAGIGIALFLVAAFFALTGFWVLVVAAILGLAEALPAWLAALIVAVVFLVVAALLALIGIGRLKKGLPPVPKDSIDSVKEDLDAVKGVGRYDR